MAKTWFIVLKKCKPIPWSVRLNTKTCRLYNPRSKDLHATRVMIRDAYRDLPMKGPVRLDFEFGMPMPKTTHLRRVISEHSMPHIKDPDATNMQKFYEDSLKGIVIKDDNQVVEISSKKFYSVVPYVQIEVTELPYAPYDMFEGE